jgi:adenylate cyclase class 2
MIEMEIKAYLNDETLNNFYKLAPKLISSSTQSDVYYNAPNRNFKETDEALRIRVSNGHAEVTYKGPKIDAETKARKEINVKIDDYQKFNTILKILNFKRIKSVDKVRRQYECEGLSVMIDEVKDLGRFLEVEVLVEGNFEAAKERIFSLLNRIGLDKEKLTRESYLELLLKKRTRIHR